VIGNLHQLFCNLVAALLGNSCRTFEKQRDRPCADVVWGPPHAYKMRLCYAALAAIGGAQTGSGGLVMGDFLLAGAILGALFGSIHAIHVYRQRVRDEGASPRQALYFAIWAVGLWTLFGAYLLAFWIIGAVGLGVSRLRGAAEAEQ